MVRQTDASKHNNDCSYLLVLLLADLRRTYFITEPLGTPIVCTVNLNRKDILDNLKKKVYNKTGVPPQLQKLFYKNRLINDSDSLKRVQHEAYIVQIIAIVGGGNEFALIKVSSFALTVISISVLTVTKECIDILSAHNTALKLWTVYLQLLQWKIQLPFQKMNMTWNCPLQSRSHL